MYSRLQLDLSNYTYTIFVLTNILYNNQKLQKLLSNKKKLGTCEASIFDSNSNRRSDSFRFESDEPIRKFRIAAPATLEFIVMTGL